MNSVSMVNCTECGGMHRTHDVEFLNIEEDWKGRDVFHYVCPATQVPSQAHVYTSAPSGQPPSWRNRL